MTTRATGVRGGTERQVRGAVIAVLLLAGPAAPPGRVRALRLAGARVTGELDLTSAIIDCEIHCEVCSFSGVLSLRHATSPSVSLCGSSLPELSAEALRCPGLDMRDAVVEGNVWVQGSDITIDLNLDRARVGGWINGNLLTIGSWFNGRHGLSVGRFVSLAGARINGSTYGNPTSTPQGLTPAPYPCGAPQWARSSTVRKEVPCWNWTHWPTRGSPRCLRARRPFDCPGSGKTSQANTARSPTSNWQPPTESSATTAKPGVCSGPNTVTTARRRRGRPRSGTGCKTSSRVTATAPPSRALGWPLATTLVAGLTRVLGRS